METLTINGSWSQFSAPLTNLTPFRTHGNLRGITGANWTGAGRMPAGWRDLYLQQARSGHIAYTVMSYETPIAWCIRDDDSIDHWYFPGVRYSVTTSKAQGRIATALSQMPVYLAEQFCQGGGVQWLATPAALTHDTNGGA